MSSSQPLKSRRLPLLADFCIFVSPGQVALSKILLEFLLFQVTQFVSNRCRYECTTFAFADPTLQCRNHVFGYRKIDLDGFHDSISRLVQNSRNDPPQRTSFDLRGSVMDNRGRHCAHRSKLSGDLPFPPFSSSSTHENNLRAIYTGSKYTRWVYLLPVGLCNRSFPI